MPRTWDSIVHGHYPLPGSCTFSGEGSAISNPAIMTAGIALTVFAQPEISNLIDGCRLSKLDTRQAVEAVDSAFWLVALMSLRRRSDP